MNREHEDYRVRDEDYGPRRSGRTTRIIDDLIQQLFKEGIVIVFDHHKTHASALRNFKIIRNRLTIEHGMNFDYNRATLTIKTKP